jgi:hypothetical protein
MKPHPQALRLTMADEIRWDPNPDEDRPETADTLLMTDAITRDFARELQRDNLTLREQRTHLLQANHFLLGNNAALRTHLQYARHRIAELEHRRSLVHARGR